MCWDIEMFGTDFYHLIAAFVIYSILGWLVESIYMSFCNHKVTNRGFAKGPFCPIYGFGAVIGYLMLRPLKGNLVILYLVAAISATIFEYIVGKLMIKFLGELWWDYNEKPFNYKGIICLESTVAWGFYGIGVVCFLHERILGAVDIIERSTGIILILVILSLVLIDYTLQLLKVFGVNTNRPKAFLVRRYQNIKARWN